jgi:hypothetical protein
MLAALEVIQDGRPVNDSSFQEDRQALLETCLEDAKRLNQAHFASELRAALAKESLTR